MNRSEKKRLAVLLFLGLVVGLILAVAFPVKRKWTFYNKVINERISTIQTYQQQIANKPILSKEVERLSTIYHETGLFMKAESAEVAGATLQSAVRDTLKENGATIRSTEVTSAATLPEGRAEVKVNAMFKSIESLITVLAAIKDNKPALRIVSANFRPQMRRQRVRVNNRIVDSMVQNGTVHVRMNIQAFYESGEQ